MHDHVEEEDISQYRHDQREREEVDEFVAAPDRFIDGADALLTTDVEDERQKEGDESARPEVPFVFAVESVGQRGGKTDCAYAEQYQDNWREAT